MKSRMCVKCHTPVANINLKNNDPKEVYAVVGVDCTSSPAAD